MKTKIMGVMGIIGVMVLAVMVRRDGFHREAITKLEARVERAEGNYLALSNSLSRLSEAGLVHAKVFADSWKSTERVIGLTERHTDMLVELNERVQWLERAKTNAPAVRTVFVPGR